MGAGSPIGKGAEAKAWWRRCLIIIHMIMQMKRKHRIGLSTYFYGYIITKMIKLLEEFGISKYIIYTVYVPSSIQCGTCLIGD